ncbi:TonB family protein [Rubrivivax sp. RP6-9]|uniref:TonB family protein n=1 Tax=Rubrivivax sp. RP6-9 TaxID=3415750 RepID=UPI003CC63F7A
MAHKATGQQDGRSASHPMRCAVDWRIRVDYAQQQRNPGKHAVGIGVVIALHLALGWALVNGLAQRLIEVVKAPIETKIIEETKPPEPPPPENLPPPPKFAPPPPSFVPPPEVNVAPPPTPAPTITTTQVAPPPAPPVFIQPPAPPAPPAPPPPRAAAQPAIFNLQECAPTGSDYPRAARSAEAVGTTRIRFQIDATGKMVGASIVKSAGPTREHKLLDRVAMDKLGACKFGPGTDENGRAVGASKDVEYVWNLN